jgi:hypothetical protein
MFRRRPAPAGVYAMRIDEINCSGEVIYLNSDALGEDNEITGIAR